MFSFSNYERLICDNGNIFQQIASIFLLQRLLSKARERSQPSLQAGVGSFISVLRKKTDVMQLAGRRSRWNYPWSNVMPYTVKIIDNDREMFMNGISSYEVHECKMV